jgi:hypothetical protein
LNGKGRGNPIQIQSGTCDDAGDSVFTLESVAGEALSDEPDATPIPAEDAQPGEVIGRSQYTVDVSLEDMLAEDHAIIVHERADRLGEFVACGDIDGEVDTEGSLIINLEEFGDSGVMGRAVLADNDDGTASVTVTLADAEGDTMATDEGRDS